MCRSLCSSVGQSNSAFNEQPGLACSDYPYTPIRRGFEPATCGLGNPSNFAILLARLAFSYLLLAGFGWYSGVIVPKFQVGAFDLKRVQPLPKRNPCGTTLLPRSCKLPSWLAGRPPSPSWSEPPNGYLPRDERLDRGGYHQSPRQGYGFDLRISSFRFIASLISCPGSLPNILFTPTRMLSVPASKTLVLLLPPTTVHRLVPSASKMGAAPAVKFFTLLPSNMH